MDDPTTAGESEVAHHVCAACHATVPAVSFCGACGMAFDSEPDRWRMLLRPKVYAAAPREAAFIPRLSSTLFPRLPVRATAAYRIVLGVVLLCMVVMSLLQWNIPVATISVLGIPLLFMVYAWESDAFRDDLRRMIVALVVGTGIGLVWWWLSGDFISEKYGVTNAAAQALQNSLVEEGLAITLIGAVLMVLPLPLIRLIPSSDSDSLDGYALGAAGALAHMTASYIVWWMPQIVAGLVTTQTTTPTRMLADTITFGVIDPLTTITLAGMVGVSLWFRPDPAGPQPGRARAAVILCAVINAVIYALVWGIDAEEWPRGLEVGLNLAMTVLSLLVLRIGLQVALLNEERENVTGEPMLCVSCENVVPDMAFCSACGEAARASSITSRCERREHPPVAVSAADLPAS